VTLTLTRAGLAFTVDGRAFASAVGWAAKRVSAKPDVPTLGGIPLVVDNGILTVSGFDFEACASARIPVESDSAGRLLVSGRLLTAMVGSFDDCPIDAVATEAMLTLTCGRAQVGLPLMSASDYPDLPSLPQVIGEVDGRAFAQTVKLVGSACDFHKERGVEGFTGVNLAFGSETIAVDATNRHRAGWADIPWRPLGGDSPGRIALPRGTHLTDSVADLAANGETVTIGLADGLLSLATPSRSVILRLVAEPFKHFRSRLPHWSETPTRIDVARFKRAVDRVRLLSAADDVPHAVISFGSNEVTVRGTSEDGVAAESVECEYVGAPTTLVVSVRYLLAALANAGSSTLELSLGQPNHPLQMKPAVEDATFAQLVMPTDPRILGVVP
jgi:DNA polymerase III subunit beta